jgi:hypothetical protein
MMKVHHDKQLHKTPGTAPLITDICEDPIVTEKCNNKMALLLH